MRFIRIKMHDLYINNVRGLVSITDTNVHDVEISNLEGRGGPTLVLILRHVHAAVDNLLQIFNRCIRKDLSIAYLYNVRATYVHNKADLRV